MFQRHRHRLCLPLPRPFFGCENLETRFISSPVTSSPYVLIFSSSSSSSSHHPPPSLFAVLSLRMTAGFLLYIFYAHFRSAFLSLSFLSLPGRGKALIYWNEVEDRTRGGQRAAVAAGGMPRGIYWSSCSLVHSFLTRRRLTPCRRCLCRNSQTRVSRPLQAIRTFSSSSSRFVGSFERRDS